MKTTSLHIAFAALLSLLSFASCSRNDEVAVAEGEEGKVYVTLTLSINGEEVGSRATWEDNDNRGDGNEWENTIDDLQILIYDANNNYVGKVEDLIQLLDGRYSGTLSSDAEWTGNTNYKIMAFANCPSIDNPSNISTLDYTRANVSYIPMWGVTTTTFDLTPGESDDIGSIDLLRAMAKVEVFMDAEGYTIDKISVDKSNPQGYCLPNGYNSVSETDRLDMEGETPASFNPYTSGTPESKAADGQHYIYLPEYDNSTKPAKIQVTVNDKPYDLEFKDYENGVPTGDPYDIVRNHIYRYTITGVNDGKLVIKYKAMLWELVTSEIGYTASISCDLRAENSDEEAQYGILHKPTYTSKKYNNGGDYSILKPGTAGAIYRFDLQAPAGTVWTAHLSNNEDFYFSDSNYKDDKKLVSTGIARGSSDKYLPYYIQINARNPWQAIEDENGEDLKEGKIDFNTLSDWGREVESEHRVVDTYFYITVSVDGIHETELEINPIESESTYFKDNRRFPGTATRIWIRQVPAQKGRGQENQEVKETWPAQELAKNVNPTEAEFQWWRVNPYWK